MAIMLFPCAMCSPVYCLTLHILSRLLLVYFPHLPALLPLLFVALFNLPVYSVLF